MRKRHNLWIWISLISVLFAVFLWWNYSPPAAFPDNRELLKEMNSSLEEYGARDKVDRIQKVIHADSRHVAVPFVSEDGDYGMSFWIWVKRKWEMTSLESSGEPRMWMIDYADPSSYFLTWNIDPESAAEKLTAHMIRRRDYGVADYKHYYFPRIQLSNEITLAKESFGAMPLPATWQEVLNSSIQLEDIGTSPWFNSYSSQAMQFEFVWNVLDDKGKSVSQEVLFESSNYSYGASNVQIMMRIEENELE